MGTRHLLRRAHYLPAILFALYSCLLILLTLPPVQRELLFLHHVPIPLSPYYDNAERYGLAPFKTRNLRLETSDGEEIGAWHVLPRSVYTSLEPFPPLRPLDDDLFKRALKNRPTVIYLHGNAGTRAVPHRVRGYSAFSTYLDCNVLAIDYRGYADSSGVPTEEGLVLDAKAAYNFVADAVGTKQAGDNVILVGQSLGTGVASGLAGLLAKEDISPRAIALIAPFSSITELITNFRLFRFIPILGPLAKLPTIQQYFQSFLLHSFDSVSALENVTSPTLLLHAVNDKTIPHTHSSFLFNSLFNNSLTAGSLGSNGIVEVDYPGWGVVRSYDRPGKGEVVWWEGRNGGHDELGWAEGTLDLIARIAKL